MPWLSQPGCGREICQLETTPPASEPFASAASLADSGWRLTKISSCAWIISASDGREPPVTEVPAETAGPRLTGGRKAVLLMVVSAGSAELAGVVAMNIALPTR